MNKKQLCAELFSSLFGPTTGKLIDASTDDDSVIIAKCRSKIAAFFGEERATFFSTYIEHPSEDIKAKILVK